MKSLLRDTRIQRLLVANTLGSIGSGITIFAVPWLLVHQPDGSAAYRHVTIVTTLALFALMPAYGAWIDHHSRKTALLASEVFGFVAMSGLALAGGLLGGYTPLLLMTVYFCGMCYYTLHYPAKFAFIQQIVDRRQYQSLMGLIEIQGQIAMMLAGGLGALLVDHVPLWVILSVDASTYLISFCLQATLPYEATHLVPTTSASSATGGGPTALFSSIGAGWHWLRERPALGLFFTCSLLPFIVLMVSNYLFPVYVAQTLHAGAAYFGYGEVIFALGAMAAGALLPRLLAHASAYSAIFGCAATFTLALLAITVFHHPWLYLAAALLLGFGNAGSRVARNTLMLHLVPASVMGRVGVFYSVFDRLLRTALVGAMAVIDWWGPPAGFAILLVLMFAALVGLHLARGAVRAQTLAPAV